MDLPRVPWCKARNRNSSILSSCESNWTGINQQISKQQKAFRKEFHAGALGFEHFVSHNRAVSIL